MTDNDLQLRWADRLATAARGGSLSRRRLLQRATVIGLSAGATGWLLSACGGDDGDDGAEAGGSGDAPGATPRRGGTLRLGVPTPPTAVEPVTMYDGSAIAIVQLVNEYLAWLEPDFALTPRLAERWEPVDDGQRWTFTLRQGVTFSDGSPFDAEAVKATFDRLLDPASESAAISAFGDVLEQGAVSADDEHTVTFTLSRPFSDFPYLVAASNYNTVILPADYDGNWTDAAVGTGPFTLASYSADTGATLVRNESYWQPDRPYLDGVDVVFYADPQAGVLALQSDEIDTQLGTPASDITIVEGVEGIAIDQTSGTGITAFNLRVDTAPFDQVEVRRAIAVALDRPGVVSIVTSDTAEVGNDHLFAPAYPASPTDLDQREQDGDEVRELLDAAGVDRLRFTLSFDPPSEPYALALQDQLAQADIEVTLDRQESDVFYGEDGADDAPWLSPPATLVGWAGRPVPSQYLGPMVTSDGIWNSARYANDDLDAAVRAYDAATDDATKRSQARIIAETLHEEVPVIITYWQGQNRAANTARFRGVAAHPSSYVDLTEVSRA